MGAEAPLNVIVTATDATDEVAVNSTWVLVAESSKPVVVVGGSPTNLLTRNEDAWTFVGSGGVPGYTVTVDWGDGTSSGELALAEPGPVTASHSYSTRGEYVVRASLTDAGGESAVTTATAVVHDPVTIAAFSGPAALDPDESGTWTAEIAQGWPPYELSIDWGDGSTPYTAGVGEEAGAEHAFQDEGTFSISANVTDGTGLSAQGTASVDVPRPPLTFTVKIPTATIRMPNGDRVTARADPIKGSVDWAKQTISLDMGTAGVVSGPLAADGSFRITFTVPAPPLPNGALASASKAIIDGTLTIDEDRWRVTGGSARVRQQWPSGARLLGTGTIG